MIHRILEDKIKSQLGNKKAIVIIGARQAGAPGQGFGSSNRKPSVIQRNWQPDRA